MVSSKDRKHSGRVSSKLTIPNKLAKEEALDSNLEYYDDWTDHRDGFRRPFDNTKIRPEYMFLSERLEIKKFNNKLKKQEKIRKVKKENIYDKT